jgi:hypothetical protein
MLDETLAEMVVELAAMKVVKMVGWMASPMVDVKVASWVRMKVGLLVDPMVLPKAAWLAEHLAVKMVETTEKEWGELLVGRSAYLWLELKSE